MSSSFIKKPTGEILGRVDSDGVFYNKNGERVGSFDARNGYVYNKYGQPTAVFDTNSAQSLEKIILDMLQKK